jgi:hypothetical protein
MISEEMIKMKKEMMIGGTGENVSASTASPKVIGHPWLEIHLDKGDGGPLRLTAHSRTVNY